MSTSKCWICGGIADSSEHIPKASDIKRYFGAPAIGHPLYFHSEARRNVRIQGINSNRLKSGARICANCNNSRTQPYDRAWERLSDYLQKNAERVAVTGSFDLRKAYPNGPYRKQALCAHLYFVKLFGCVKLR